MSITPSGFGTAGGAEDEPDFISGSTPASGQTGIAEEFDKLGGDVEGIENRIVLDEGLTLTAGTAAGGDLAGTFPNVTVAKVSGIAVSGAPSAGQILVATSGSTATWQTIATGAAPSNTSIPVISGVPQVGYLLTTTTGNWSNAPTFFAYQWNRNGTPIAGAAAMSPTYTLVTADAGNTVTVTVTASNTVSNASSTSGPTATIAPASSGPVNTTLPAIAGAVAVGSTLASSNGAWTGNPTSYSYQWARNGATIMGATAAAYTVQVADQGQTLTCTVTATNTVGSTPATTNPTATVPVPVVVTVTAPTDLTGPVITDNTSGAVMTGVAPSVGEVLTVSNGTWAGVFTASTPPAAMVGAPYSYPFASSGASSYAVTSGLLPTGLTLSPAGVLSGTPTSSGTATFIITASGTVAGTPFTSPSGTLSLVVSNAPAPVFTAATPPGAYVNAAYSYPFAASNTTSYAVTTGTLPGGLTLNNATGVLSGTPTTAGTATFVITATGPGGPTPTGTLTIVTGAVSTYKTVVLADSPIGYWRLNETFGTTAVDSSGHGYNGTYTGTYKLGAASPITGDSTAAAMDLTADAGGGSVGYVTIPDTAALNPTGTALTLECWVKAKTAGTPATQYAGWVWKQNASNTADWGLQADVTGAHPGMQVTTSSGGVVVSASGSSDSGTWIHVVGVYNGSNVVIYVNGVAESNTSLSGPITSLSGSPLIIGAISNYTAYQWNGYIAEVAVYNTALSAARVLAHYNAAATVVPAVVPVSTATNIPLAPTGPGVAAANLRNVFADDFNQATLSSLWAPSNNPGGGGPFSFANNPYELEEYANAQVTTTNSLCSLTAIPYPAGVSGNGGTKYYLSGTMNTGVTSGFLFSPSNAGTIYIEAKIKIPGAATGSAGSIFPAFWATTYRTFGLSANDNNYTREMDFFEFGTRENASTVGQPNYIDSANIYPANGYGSGQLPSNNGNIQSAVLGTDMSQAFHLYTAAINANGSFTLWIDGAHQWDLAAETATDWMGIVLNYALVEPPGAGFTSDSMQIDYVSVWQTTAVAVGSGIIGGGTAPGTVVPAIPVNTVVPTISGTASVTSTLNVSQGTWTGTPTTYAYQWNRTGTAISGATASSYTLVTADLGNTITCTVRANNTAGASTPVTTVATATVTAAPAGVSVVFPSAAGHIDVTAHGADNTGTTDCTSIINGLIAAASPGGGNGLVLYYPNGTYKISGSLSSYQNGNYYCNIVHQGQSQTGTIIQCANGTWASGSSYGPPANGGPQAMISLTSQTYSGQPSNGGGNQAFNNYVYDMTLQLGNNPGGGCLSFVGSNAAAVRRVTMTCTAGYTALDIGRGNNGPLLVQDVTTSGPFVNPVIGVGAEEFSIIMERVNVGTSGSATYSFTTGGAVYAVKDCVFPQGVSISGAGAGGAAIGYWTSSGGTVPTTTNTGGGQVGSFGPGVGGFTITPPNTPQVPYDTNMANWANAATMGWQAALNSGATTVYWPNQDFITTSAGGYTVPSTVNRIIWMSNGFNVNYTGTFFTTTGSSSTPLVIERAWFTGPSTGNSTVFVQHNSSRDLVVSDWNGYGTVQTTSGGGRVFLDNTCNVRCDLVSGGFFYARQHNFEDPTISALTNHGGTAWLLGLKTERSGSGSWITAPGGLTEMLAGFNYPETSGNPRTTIPYVFSGSASFAIQWVTNVFNGPNYTTQVTLNGSASGFTNNQVARNSVGTYGTAFSTGAGAVYTGE